MAIINLVQSAATNSGSTSTLSATYSLAVTPGNILVAGFGWTNTARSISTFSDNQFGAWSTAKGAGSGASVAGIFYLPSVVSSSVTPTVTVVMNGTTACFLTIMEFTGLTALVDQVGNSTITTTTSSSTSTSAATTNATELVVNTIVLGTSATFTQGAGYTLVGSSNLNQGTQWAATTSTGTQTATMTWTTSASGNSIITTFFPSGTVTPAPIYSRRYVQYNI